MNSSRSSIPGPSPISSNLEKGASRGPNWEVVAQMWARVQEFEKEQAAKQAQGLALKMRGKRVRKTAQVVRHG